MNEYEKQQEYYDKAMKKLIETKKDFDKLTPQNKDKFAEQVVGMYGFAAIIDMFRKQW